jgi:hypothetical protein
MKMGCNVSGHRGQIPLKVRDRADNSKNKDTYEKLLGSKQQGGHVLQIIR